MTEEEMGKLLEHTQRINKIMCEDLAIKIQKNDLRISKLQSRLDKLEKNKDKQK